MNKGKNIIYTLFGALFLSGLSWFFTSNESLFGPSAGNIVYQGFPFHFFEYNFAVRSEILWQWFIIDVIFYALIISSVRYLIYLWLKQNKVRPLISAAILGSVFLFINIGTIDSCVTGFPVEFYVQCMGNSEIGFWFSAYGWILDSVFWLSIAAVLVAAAYYCFLSASKKAFLMHPSILFGLRSAWFTITLVSLLGLIIGIKELVFGLGVSIGGIFVLKYLTFYYKNYQGEVRRLFFSRMGYIIAGFFLGFGLLSLGFNLAYEGGWFDFTDSGFVLLSLPTSLLFNLEYDSGEFAQRLLLYALVFLNFFVVTYTVDLTVYILSKVVKLIKKDNKAHI